VVLDHKTVEAPPPFFLQILPRSTNFVCHFVGDLGSVVVHVDVVTLQVRQPSNSNASTCLRLFAVRHARDTTVT